MPTVRKTRPEAEEPAFNNKILASLPIEELALIELLLFKTTLVSSQTLFDQGGMLDSVYFIEEGLLGLVVEVGSNETIQVAMTGNEGAIGLMLLLKADLFTQYWSIVQVAGSAYRMRSVDFRRMIDCAPNFKALCMQHITSLFRQVAQTAACNGKHDSTKRICRILMMAYDRSNGVEILLTHDQVAWMTGIRRAGVSSFISMLQAEGMLRKSRGRISILDRDGLSKRACDCYRRLQST